ncbi:ATP-dependent zinc protease family protein [Endozoicomonadaceae bacterium StTr2]
MSTLNPSPELSSSFGPLVGPVIRQVMTALLLLICTLIRPVVAADSCPCENALPVFGVLEQARLADLDNMEVKALIDTGATTTALDARNIRIHVNRQGKRWVYYDFKHKPSGKTISRHQPVSRTAYILTHKGPPAERAVIKQTILIGNTRRKVEVSLINRSSFPQQLLIGRNYLQQTALVNSGQVFLMEPPP